MYITVIFAGKWKYMTFLSLNQINQNNQANCISEAYYPNHDDFEGLAPEPPTTANAIFIMLSLTGPIE